MLLSVAKAQLFIKFLIYFSLSLSLHSRILHPSLFPTGKKLWLLIDDRLNFSGQSFESAASSLMRSAALAEIYLASGIQELDLNDGHISAKETLQRWLSVKSVISTASSNAIKQQEAALDEGKRTFRSIGKGFCGEVFDQVGTGRVVKRAFHPQNLELWNDFRRRTEVYLEITHAISNEINVDLLVPKPFRYLTQNSEEWQNQNRDKWPSAALREV